jgi:hypothetical protein
MARKLDAGPKGTFEIMLVVIGSSPDRAKWLADCSASIRREHIAVVNSGYELAKIRWVMENTKADRFLFLQDSWQVKDDGFWDLLEAQSGSLAITDDPYYYGCYAGVYERWVIEQIGIPVMTDKADAISNEITWHQSYVKTVGELTVLFPKIRDSNATRQVELHGRKNLVLENEYLVKYKGTWQ